MLTLEQVEWWYDADGYPQRVVELETEHLANLLPYLRRRATQLRDHRRWWETYVSVGPEAPSRAPASRELDARGALDWLNDRPLVRALEAELRRRGAVDGEVLDVVVTDEVAGIEKKDHVGDAWETS